MDKGLKIRVITCKEGDTWTAQCLEYDIGAQGDTLEDATSRFEMVLIANLKESLERTGEAFAGIDAAPKYFHRLWDRRSDFSSQKNFPYHNANNGSVDVDMALCA